ncbi:D-alanine--D-alanine ligase [Acetivibrio mesophilus]|uniref:D-alanine--D-alanine ligase n=1 Tax=Acetivibrio mesophilus TaxID=2487273 RepID=A0A4Q0I3P9_9FIRM|nr:D-alanine--D-alanine ligase [Acetivibrio mesophilus]ODM26664.1 D-alanine--D-alanine ligase A [Clostridium sp. Bc-iso-3]RXE58904.1 D-alanine--D-alanine ligase [Acetivibrio mesophilus]HHV28454.1 D-alanine--D-alanine ligase [Clostridium sp.]
MGDKKRVLIVFGGQSSEHEVSRISVTSILKNIDSDKFDVSMMGITKDGKWLPYSGPIDKIPSGEWEQISLKDRTRSITDKISLIDNIVSRVDHAGELDTASMNDEKGKKIDVVFPVLHGCNGEDGTIQGFFELAGIPYVGCGVLGSAVGMDKIYAKIIFEKAGIPQADYLYFTRKEIAANIDSVADRIEEKFRYPIFVKPSNAGSSVGVTKAHDKNELKEALIYAAKYDRKVLIEEFINGREVECAVLGNDDPIASTVGEIIPGNEFYDYKAKYIDNSSKIKIPADLPEETIEEIRDYAVKAFKALDCAGLSRVDFFVHKETGRVYINEINTMPGFTSISMYPMLWEASGIPYSELIERLIELAIERYKDNSREYDE